MTQAQFKEADSNPVFLLADTVGMDLHDMNGVIRGMKPKFFSVGGLLRVQSDVVVTVDQRSKEVVTAFMRIRHHLWAYFIITAQSQFVLFFDGNRAKIRVGGEREFGRRQGSETLKLIKPAVTKAFHYQESGWVETDPTPLLSDL